MMPLDNNLASKQASKDESQSSGGGGGGRKNSSLRPPDQPLKCPRCDSPNTKFCYYNNYSLTQPRHFCKTCRRYWTKGGALRNVPIGGGCRKNKKTKSCSPRFITGDSSSKDSSSDLGGLKFLNGLSPPAMDFQLGGLTFPPARLATANQFSSSYGEPSRAPFINFDPLGFNFPLSSHVLMKQGDHPHQQQHNNPSGGGLVNFPEMGVSNNLHHNTSLASSIESLSSINQDLHWKLQQQRLAMLFGGGGGGGGAGENDQQQQQKEIALETQTQKLQPILFQNLDISKPTQPSLGGDSRKDGGGSSAGGGGSLATEWFFDNSYAPVNVNPPTPTNSNSAGNEQQASINNWNGIQTWNHQLNQYSALP